MVKERFLRLKYIRAEFEEWGEKMINKSNKSFKWIILSIVSLVLLVITNLDEIQLPSGRTAEVLSQMKIKDVVNIVAILSGISGILVGAASIRISNLGAVQEYFQQGDSKEYTEARRRVYDKIQKKQKIDKEDIDAGIVVSFFHFWGLMVKKHYLPVWVFESASGYAVIRLYEGITDMIEERRKDNPQYAEYFEWLYKKVKKKLD